MSYHWIINQEKKAKFVKELRDLADAIEKDEVFIDKWESYTKEEIRQRTTLSIEISISHRL